MDLGKAALVIVITLILVIIFNVAIYRSLRGERTVNQIKMLRRVTHRARKPWQDENEKLEELSRRVAKLKHEDILKSDEESESIP